MEPLKTGRPSAARPPNVLIIRNVQTNDSGSYTVTVKSALELVTDPAMFVTLTV